ncbi:MAG TPA: hypothetical protein VGI44_09950, partial [Acidimicrobiales bacterium]
MSRRGPRVVVATSAESLSLDDSWPLLREALAVEGLASSVRVWNDPTVDWGRFDLVLASFAWGYVLHRRDFVDWAYEVETRTRLENSASILDWGSDKT